MKDLEKLPNGHFINTIINEDLKTGKYGDRVHTRFPPEPNGYLHIGHAKSICLNFGLAEEYDGLCNMRFDDTNPAKEEEEFIKSIKEDIHWLGFDWQDRLYFASNYFEKLYNYACDLIKAGKAYVCDLSQEEMRAMRGTPTKAGTLSPHASRTVEENLQIFAEMRAGKYADGQKVLRARIDMASSNFNMRDPVIYRIQHSHHQRTGDDWCIYPMYDFAHPLSDAMEEITHSICTLEFENHRPLYEWFLQNLDVPCQSQQIEFARLNITYTVMSKRKLRRLVEENIVTGWDDPRMPTLAGLRRRGYTPNAIRKFCENIGVAKANSTVEIQMLEHCLREDLNINADRMMAVTDPIKVFITNYGDDKTEMLPAEINPEKPEKGTRVIPFSDTVYIDGSDFMEEPIKGFRRLVPGGEVRLKYAYIIKCEEIIKDEHGKVIELRCTYDPQTKSGHDSSGKKVKGTIQWVEACTGADAEIRLYNHLFTKENPDDVEEGQDFTDFINPDSLVVKDAMVELSVADARPGVPYQFLRQGYFTADKTSNEFRPVFNLSVALKDGWKKNKK